MRTVQTNTRDLNNYMIVLTECAFVGDGETSIHFAGPNDKQKSSVIVSVSKKLPISQSHTSNRNVVRHGIDDEHAFPPFARINRLGPGPRITDDTLIKIPQSKASSKTVSVIRASGFADMKIFFYSNVNPTDTQQMRLLSLLSKIVLASKIHSRNN